MYTNASCTLYLQQEGGRYRRVPVEAVFWDPKPRADGTATVYIPLDTAVLPLQQPEERHYIARGLLPDEIYDTRTLHALLQRRKLYTVQTILKRDYGSRPMRHWEVQAL